MFLQVIKNDSVPSKVGLISLFSSLGMFKGKGEAEWTTKWEPAIIYLKIQTLKDLLIQVQFYQNLF